MKKVCGSCGKEHKKKPEEFDKRFLEVLNLLVLQFEKVAPGDTPNTLESRIKEAYKEWESLCENCRKKIPDSPKKLPKELIGRFLSSIPSIDELFELMIFEEMKFTPKAWKICQESSRKI